MDKDVFFAVKDSMSRVTYEVVMWHLAKVTVDRKMHMFIDSVPFCAAPPAFMNTKQTR